MRSILEALRTGDAKTRLAIVSDIVSIVGVSLATVVGGALALNTNLDIDNVVGTVVISLFSLAGVSLVVLLFLGSSSWVRRRFENNSTARQLLQISLWSTFGGLFLLAAFFSYEILSHVRFVRQP